ncbi:MAG: hypothetical protein OXI67_17845 [Candidatus Poribacteria bacterium]|nr:hypothetical protein [Candidatus Poribacteria bacterium]
MKRLTASTLFLLIALFLGATFTNTANANDAEIEALLDEIASLEQELTRLKKSVDSKQFDIETARRNLSYIADTIANVDMYIASAKAELAAADNDAERADWLAVIADLEKYRTEQKSEYNSVAYTIHLLEVEIDGLNTDIAKVEKEITIAYARLFELLND